MAILFQRLLLVAGLLVLLVLLVEIGVSVAATTHGNIPVRVVHVVAGPYPLTVNLYKDPANAGFALPFSVVSESQLGGKLSYDISSLPSKGVSATPVRAGINQDAKAPNIWQGAAEITVQGTWKLHIVVMGPTGKGVVDVPIVASAPPAIPLWLGWLLGFIPLVGLLLFLFLLHGSKSLPAQSVHA